MKKQYMAIDQYGNTEHSLGQYPRKELLKRCGYKNAQKMYREHKDGSSSHTGYVIGEHWFTLYEVLPFRKLNN